MEKFFFLAVVAILATFAPSTSFAEVIFASEVAKPVSVPILANSDMVPVEKVYVHPPARNPNGCPQGFSCVPINKMLRTQGPPVMDEPLNKPPVMDPEDAKKLPHGITPRCGPRGETDCGYNKPPVKRK